MALASVGTGTLSAGSAGGGTLGTILAYDVTGCFIKTTGGTGGGGTGGANNQARKIATYNTSTGAFTVSPNWETTPDNTTTYAVLLPEGVTLGMLQTINPATPGRKPVVDASGLVDANAVKVGPTGSGIAQTAGDIPALINTVDDFLDTEIAAIKAKTDNLPTDPADQSAVESAITAATSPLATAANLAVVAGYIDTEIAAIKAVTDAIGATGSGLSAIPWNAAWDDEVQSEVQDAIEANNLDHLVKSAVDTDFATTVHVDSVVGQLAQTADGGFARATDSLEAIRDRGDAAWITGSGGSGGGTGANTVTITVDDGTDPLENAKVRMTNGAESYLVETDVDGEAVFALDSATWAVAITKPGYQFTPTTLLVNVGDTQTYSMDALTITPSDPGQVTGYLVCYGTDGGVESGASVSLRQEKPAAGSGIAYDGATRTATANGAGIAEFAGLFPGGTYRLWRGTSTADARQILIPSDADDPYALISIVGAP